MSSPWNRRPAGGASPLYLVDATLAELPRRPPPEAAASWARRLAGLGVERICGGELDDSGWSEEWVRLVRNSSCQPVLEFNLTPPNKVTPRWFRSQSGLAVRLMTPGEGLLDGLGFPGVTLAIPNATSLDPITLSNRIRLAESYGYHRLEIIGQQGRPWGRGLHSLLQFVLGLCGQIQVGWSCSDGLGLSLSQGLAAWQGGAQFLRVCLAGLGGTIPLEGMLRDVDTFQEFHQFAGRYLGIPMPNSS
ncbi:hypothetical protein JST97_38735 [bacterium]|nr:hypothetical protein [bacterium]